MLSMSPSMGLILWLWATVQYPVKSANCTESSTRWTFNQDGVSPCDVANTLDRVCFPGDDAPDPRNPGEQYSGPSESESNGCLCSSVLYSMLSACAICQGATLDEWADYNSQCQPKFVSLGVFPPGIPNGTKVPAWAFMDVSKNNIWLAQDAQALAGKVPDLTANPSTSIIPVTASSTQSKSSSSAHTTSSSLPVQSDKNSPEGGQGKESHAGPIAGGVIGGLVVAALVAVGAWYVYRRKFRQPFVPHPKEPGPPALVIKEKPLKPYDPTDPTTFPKSPFTNPYTNPSGPGMGYTGVPEV